MTVTDSAIASDAVRYNGHRYIYGGAPGKNGQHGWDCSSCANWVIGHDMGLPIPGDSHYDGSEHGPATGEWLIWTGCTTISKSDIQAGDIMVWQTHMGIATDNTHMFSALDEAEGSKVTTIAEGAPFGEILVPRRLKNTTAGASGSIATTGLTSSILGDLNPAQWASAIEQDAIDNPVKSAWNWVLDALGVKSLTDLLERGALILFGAVLIIMGLISITSGGNNSPVKNVQESKQEGVNDATEESNETEDDAASQAGRLKSGNSDTAATAAESAL